MHRYKVMDPNPIDEGVNYRTLLANCKKDEKVAIKILKKKFYNIEECRLHKEVQVVQALNHKNVLKMLELINDSNELLMVFEYLPENVKRVMKKRDIPYSETETKVIMQQVFQGLSYIHKMGYMHRNVRPDILLCDKEVTTVKISDFSMAKSVDDTVGEYDVPSVWYIAPEVLLGANNYTVMIDVWAAGCIMAELLTGKPLLPGTSNSDQMKIICELIGTFEKRDWPDGAMLRHSIGYSLPNRNYGKGLEEAGVCASPDAKGLIMQLLTWAPEKRMSADLALRHDFFKSDGEFVNKHESQEILDYTKVRLKEWKGKWEADLNRASIKEFDGILANTNRRQPHGDIHSNRNKFAGFEKSNPLLGDSTPRGKWNKSQANANNSIHNIDESFRTQRMNEPGRSYPIERQSPEKNPDRNPFEEELQSREERRSRQSVQNMDPLVSADGHISPRRNNESPRRYNNGQLGLIGGGPDINQSEQEQAEKKRKERLLLNCKWKYDAMFGFDSMKGVLGAPSPKPEERSGPVSSRKMYSEADKTDGQKEFVRSRQQYNQEEPSPRVRPILSRKTSFEKFASIDHTARSERRRTRQRAKHGDPFMSELLGRKPEVKPQVQDSQSFQTHQNENSRDHGLGNSGQYTPSWTEKNEIRAY